MTTKTALSRKHDTDREQPKDDENYENIFRTNKHDNVIKTGTLQQDFKK